MLYYCLDHVTEQQTEFAANVSGLRSEWVVFRVSSEAEAVLHEAMIAVIAFSLNHMFQIE